MAGLTKRVQVLFNPEQLKELKKRAKAREGSVGELIREAVEEKYLSKTLTEEKVAAAKKIIAMELPISDWEEMEKEIIQAHLGKG